MLLDHEVTLHFSQELYDDIHVLFSGVHLITWLISDACYGFSLKIVFFLFAVNGPCRGHGESGGSVSFDFRCMTAFQATPGEFPIDL